MTPWEFERNMDTIRDGLSRSMSPYEICAAYKDRITVSPSTVYRWVEAGYGGLRNMDLERKVGFKPRRKAPVRKSTHHGPERSYEAFCRLDGETRAGAAEMDTVLGRKGDSQCVLSLYSRPTHFQMYLLLACRASGDVVEALDGLEAAMGLAAFQALFGTILTDNGPEFEDVAAMERSATKPGKARCRVFYCDPRQSQQKAGCEKNHTEFRQLLPKGGASFDSLGRRDVAVVCSHANSNPRKSLVDMTPIGMLRAIPGKVAQGLLEGYGIEEIGRDELRLSPDAINRDRALRGEAPLVS